MRMTMTLAPTSHPLRVDEDGAVRVGRSRVPLEVIVACYRDGDSPDQIHEAYPTVSLAEVHATIAYYLDHRDEVDAYVREGQREAELARREIEASTDSAAFRERVLERARRSGRAGP